MKYGNVNLGQIEAAINRFGGEENFHRFLRGELTVSPPPRNWCLAEDGTIRFSVTSTGETGEEWANWFKANGYDLGSEAEFILHSNSFRPTTGVTYKIAVLPGTFWKDEERITSNIRAKADSLSFKQGQEVNPEIACLIWRMFSNEEIEEMGLTWIITLHDPISGSLGHPYLLGVRRHCGGHRLRASYGQPGDWWDCVDGFASIVSPACLTQSGWQSSSQVLES